MQFQTRALTASLTSVCDQFDSITLSLQKIYSRNNNTVILGSHVTETFIHSENSSHCSIFTIHLRLRKLKCSPYNFISHHHFYAQNSFSLSYTSLFLFFVYINYLMMLVVVTEVKRNFDNFQNNSLETFTNQPKHKSMDLKKKREMAPNIILCMNA